MCTWLGFCNISDHFVENNRGNNNLCMQPHGFALIKEMKKWRKIILASICKLLNFVDKVQRLLWKIEKQGGAIQVGKLDGLKI